MFCVAVGDAVHARALDEVGTQSLRHLFELPEPRRVLRGKRVDVQQQQLAWQVVRPPLPANEPEREEMLPPLCPVFPQESLRGSGEW